MSERRGVVDFPERVAQYGRDEPLPERVPVRAGPLTAVVEGGDLRYIRLGDDLVVLRLYAAIRDRNWGTIEPTYRAYQLDQRGDGFTLAFTADNASGDVDFSWRGEITGTADGTIMATMDGAAGKAFLKNRIGWCVLHPMALAGTEATVQTPEGTVDGRFPDLISPHQPFIDMEAIAHETRNGGEVEIRFEGDLFEMEDQRNWTDASYKTYSTPLRLPYPVEIQPGDRVWQRVTIRATAGSTAVAAADETVRVAVDPSRVRPLPAIGVGVAGHDDPLTEEDWALLRATRPAHLHVVLELDQPGWRERLARADGEASALDAALALEVVAGADDGLAELARALSQSTAPIAHILVFPNDGFVTTEEVLAAARAAFAAAGVAAPIGGGTRAYFTELNRATLPLDEMDVAAYTLNPQVHAFDNASLTESIAAQAETVRSARAFAGDRRLAVGPITLKPRFNPNASGPESEPAPGELPETVDYRQPSLFAAGWLAGSINSLGNAGADALTYFETTGWRGLIERRDHPLTVAAFHSWPGMVFPVYHVLADIGEFRDGQLLPVAVDDELRVQALALRAGDRLRAILANMSDGPVEVALDAPGARDVLARRLDATTLRQAASEPEAFRASRQRVNVAGDSVAIGLPAFGLVTLDATLAAGDG
jgi:hypothetical protein